jgi:hypothetical protein
VTLREFLNAIFLFIEATSLTDDEYLAAVTAGAAMGYTVETYGALLGILTDRESVSNQRDRLRYFFLAKNIAVPDLTYSKSNIFFGASLED